MTTIEDQDTNNTIDEKIDEIDEIYVDDEVDVKSGTKKGKNRVCRKHGDSCPKLNYSVPDENNELNNSISNEYSDPVMSQDDTITFKIKTSYVIGFCVFLGLCILCMGVGFVSREHNKKVESLINNATESQVKETLFSSILMLQESLNDYHCTTSINVKYYPYKYDDRFANNFLIEPPSSKIYSLEIYSSNKNIKNGYWRLALKSIFVIYRDDGVYINYISWNNNNVFKIEDTWRYLPNLIDNPDHVR